MKLIVVPEKAHGKLGFQIEWEHHVTFAGEQPTKGMPVVIMLDGLKKLTYKNLRRWIEERLPEDTEAPRSRRLVLPEGCWRPATLDDYVDSELHAWITPFESYSIEDFDAFMDRWIPEVRAAMDTVTAAQTRGERRKALKAAHKLAKGVISVVDWVPARLAGMAQKEQLERDKRRLKKLMASDSPWRDLLDGIVSLRSPNVVPRALRWIVGKLADDPSVSHTEMDELLAAIHAVPRLRDTVAYDDGFWRAALPKVALEPTVTEGTFDISDAQETGVRLDWQTWSAVRVGQISVGRSALAVYDPETERTMLIKGDRALKFEALRRGGSIERYGCTLTVKPDPSVAVRSAFLEVERLDAIAALDPAQALESVADLNLTPDHPIVVTAREAETDLAKRRVLADLLIEMRHGLDPNVAREMAHASTRRRR